MAIVSSRNCWKIKLNIHTLLIEAEHSQYFSWNIHIRKPTEPSDNGQIQNNIEFTLLAIDHIDCSWIGMNKCPEQRSLFDYCPEISRILISFLTYSSSMSKHLMQSGWFECSKSSSLDAQMATLFKVFDLNIYFRKISTISNCWFYLSSLSSSTCKWFVQWCFAYFISRLQYLILMLIYVCTNNLVVKEK